MVIVSSDRSSLRDDVLLYTHDHDDDDDHDYAFLLSLLWVTWKNSLLFRSNFQSTQSISDTSKVTKDQKSPKIYWGIINGKNLTRIAMIRIMSQL